MDLQKTVDSLRKKGYAVSVFETGREAADYLDEAIDQRLVGFGDSETLNAICLYERLSTHNEVIDPQHPKPGATFLETARACLTTDIFFTSVNAMAETGEMVNIDGAGNRVAGSLFGHEKVYFVVGANKIVPTLEEAVWRARNIAAPQNAARHHYKTPCAVNCDHCYDCQSRDRICCAQTIYYRKMRYMKMEVVLINEPFGL